MSGCKPVLKKHEAGKKCLDPISENVRNQVWMSPELLVYANAEYVYATSPIALALFWEMGGEEICLSRPLSVAFEIPPHCLNNGDKQLFCKNKWEMAL